MNPEPFTHPLTYEFQEATEANLAAAVDDGFARVKALKRETADVMARMEPLRARLAVLRGPAVLPPRRQRTATQNLTAACPRCGGPLGGVTLTAEQAATVSEAIEELATGDLGGWPACTVCRQPSEDGHDEGGCWAGAALALLRPPAAEGTTT